LTPSREPDSTPLLTRVWAQLPLQPRSATRPASSVPYTVTDEGEPLCAIPASGSNINPGKSGSKGGKRRLVFTMNSFSST
jgi:hypothetical protein